MLEECLTAKENNTEAEDKSLLRYYVKEPDIEPNYMTQFYSRSFKVHRVKVYKKTRGTKYPRISISLQYSK